MERRVLPAAVHERWKGVDRRRLLDCFRILCRFQPSEKLDAGPGWWMRPGSARAASRHALSDIIDVDNIPYLKNMGGSVTSVNLVDQLIIRITTGNLLR
jgi:hypothetical protein